MNHLFVILFLNRSNVYHCDKKKKNINIYYIQKKKERNERPIIVLNKSLLFMTNRFCSWRASHDIFKIRRKKKQTEKRKISLLVTTTTTTTTSTFIPSRSLIWWSIDCYRSIIITPSSTRCSRWILIFR